VLLVETARNLSASAIAHAREAAMLGRTATSFELQRGFLGVMESTRCHSSIEMRSLQTVYGTEDALW
jgi:hypothetical protein